MSSNPTLQGYDDPNSQLIKGLLLNAISSMDIKTAKHILKQWNGGVISRQCLSDIQEFYQNAYYGNDIQDEGEDSMYDVIKTFKPLTSDP
jgi:hypothetical protein